MNVRLVLASSLALLASACAMSLDTWDRSAAAWVGAPFAKLVERYGEPASIRVEADGHREMRYELREIDPDCVQTWVVNRADVIDSQFHNAHCRG